MKTEKHLRDNKQIRAETKVLIRKHGTVKAAKICGLCPSGLSMFMSGERHMKIEKVVEIYEALR